MEFIAKLASEKLSGWDFLIAGLVVLFVEFIIKKFFFKGKAPDVVMKVSPVVLSAIVYVVFAIVNKSVWYVSMLHGLLVGLTAMGSYDLLLKNMLSWVKELPTKGKDILKEGNEKAREAIESDK